MNPEEPQQTLESSKHRRIDDALYNRQLYVIGHEAMEKIATSNILLIGLGGLGVEIAKNIILTGVNSVTLVDHTPTSLFDLCTQFYLTPDQIRTPRAAACVEKLVALNPLYVSVQVHDGKVDKNFIRKFKVVVLADQNLEFQLQINDICHQHNIAFISVQTHGVFASLFCDFGTQFEVQDTTGEAPTSAMISAITQEARGVVTVTDEARLPFEDGELVLFSEVKGMEELNGGKPRKIQLLGPYTFSIDEDTSKYHAYQTGGYVTQVKQPKLIDFLPLQKALEEPEFLPSDFAKMDRTGQIHLAFQALHHFHKQHQRFPGPHHEGDANEVVEIVRSLNSKKKIVEEVDEKLIKLISYQALGALAPVIAFIAGVASQEVLKACSSKFHPVKQWLYFDAVEALPKDLPPSEFQPIGSRYDAQIIVLGKTLHEKIQQLKYFLVGSGAIGCEVLKIWAMMGLASGPQGIIHVTDMDIIERSNLSRQVLFREKDLEQLKSKTAANAVKQMNPDINIKAYALRVGGETEDVFNPQFYESLDGVCNALDNVEARLYMDSQCVFYKKPLLESGTLGTKGNTQVIVPFLTESYGSSRDPPEKSIPTCTLHHFPSTIDHTIQWARDVFEGLFKNQADTVNSYIDNPGFMETLQKQNSALQLETLQSIKSCLITDRPSNFDDCIRWARLKFEEYYNNNIQQLLYNFPLDMLTTSGTPFWSGPKRAPYPINFDLSKDLHLDYIIAAANLRAQIFKIEGTRDPNYFLKVLPKITVPEFTPKKIKIIMDDKQTNNGKQAQQEEVVPEEDEEEVVKKVLKELPLPSDLKGVKLTPIEFEKDVDTNFHMDFITAAANLRGSNYSIKLTDKHTCKGIAGKIIPAMVTTTAVVSGLVCIELLKTIQNKTLEEYKNGFVNLALPFFGFSEPIKPPTTKIREGWSWSLWDRFDVQGEMTLQQFIKYFEEKYQLDVQMISCGVAVIYSPFLEKAKKTERLPMKLSEVVVLVTKKPLPPSKRELIFEISVSRLEDDEDVDVPTVRYIF